MNRAIVRAAVKAAVAVGVAFGSAIVHAAPYPSAPYSTVGGATPTRYCRNPIDRSTAQVGPHAYQGINLETTGCLSGSGPNAYPDPLGKYKNTDGLYANSGGGDTEARVEKSVLLATGELVDLLLYRETGDRPSSAGGIQVWVEDSGKQITWAFEQSLVNMIQANTIAINYLTIKAANSYVLYQIPTGVFAGRYSTEGILTNGGQQPEVSHVRFWKEIDLATVPEPGAVALFGLGFLVVGLRRKRR